MKRLLRWSVCNSPAVNTISAGIFVIGIWCAITIQREFWPHAELDVIDVIVENPGASPNEIESSICEKIEEATRNIPGVKRVTSVAQTGHGAVAIQMSAQVSDRETSDLVNEVRNRVDQISTFPANAERTIVRRRQQHTTSIELGVVGRDGDDIANQLQLRSLTEQIREELLRLPAVSDARLIGAPEFQIDVELSPESLAAHGLSLSDAAQRIRMFSKEVAGGVIQTRAHEVLIRGRRHGISGDEIASIPLVESAGGGKQTVGDLGEVQDAYSEKTRLSRINGRPGLAIRIDATESDDILDVGEQIHQFARTRLMPDGYSLVTFLDRTDDVKGRLSLLSRNGWQGLLLVFLLLSLLLDFRLAIWVAAGIPLALAGGIIAMYVTGQSLNMSSMFAFLIAIGIVVDDAIIVGENIFAHQRMGKPPLRAAIDGCVEVMPAVITSVLTTSIAFLPILLMSGRAGRMTHVLPLAIISVLMFSLAEALLVLPCHLAQKRRSVEKRDWESPWNPIRYCVVVRRHVQLLVTFIIQRLYLPVLRLSVRNAALTICVCVGMLIITLATVSKGILGFSLLPRMDWNFCTVLVKFPDGTPAHVTDAATRQIEQSILHGTELTKESNLVRVVYRTVGFASGSSNEAERGSHIGSLTIQLVDSANRKVTSQELIQRWRAAASQIQGTATLEFVAGPIGVESPAIQFQLLADKRHQKQLNQAATACVAKLRSTSGIHEISKDLAPGKYEYNIQLDADSQSSGITMNDIATAIRGAVHGEEATRLQRGRHEVPVRVRYAKSDRNTLEDLRRIRLTTLEGAQLPISEFAQVNVQRGISSIRRRDQQRCISLSADVDKAIASTSAISRSIERDLIRQIRSDYPHVKVIWDGERAETNESMKRMRYGFLAVIMGMYVLLTIQFRSYVLPLLVCAVIPFSMIGAIGGHYLLGLPLTLFSIYGLVALAGIVVNDSIVLIDFVNKTHGRGVPLQEAIIQAGVRRFRPIMLTSITTVACLLPVLSETSRQAQVLAPMAVSVAFGLALSTLFVLLLIPAMYSLLPSRAQICLSMDS